MPANCFASELNMLLVHGSTRWTAKHVAAGENDFLSGVFMRCYCIHLIIIKLPVYGGDWQLEAMTASVIFLLKHLMAFYD